MTNGKPKIIFLGTPEFALPALSALVKNDLAPALVVTQPDKKAGRKQEKISPPVKTLALANNLSVAQPENKKALAKIFEQENFEVAILVAYGMIIPETILTKPRAGFLNLHPSLLPKYRGPAPMQNVILNGDKKTGVSIIGLVKQVDAGPIFAKVETDLKPDETIQTLHDRLAFLGAELLIKILPDYLAGKLKPEIQDETQVTETKVISRKDGQIDWQKSAGEISRQFRAFHPWPGIFSSLAGQRLKIANLSVIEGNLGANLTPGTLFLGSNQALLVKCGQGAIELLLVQLEGKKEMTANDFMRGQKDLVGKILGNLN